MKSNRRRRAVAAGAAAVMAGSGAAAVAKHHSQRSAITCVARSSGELPDPACTPGVVDPALTRADLCPHLGAAVVRNVPQSEKDKVRAEYNDHRAGEIDHLISLELGGSNDIHNLWPEDGKIPNPKDAVENRLHAQVCAGSITLHQAQQEIRVDWRSAR